MIKEFWNFASFVLDPLSWISKVEDSDTGTKKQIKKIQFLVWLEYKKYSIFIFFFKNKKKWLAKSCDKILKNTLEYTK